MTPRLVRMCVASMLVLAALAPVARADTWPPHCAGASRLGDGGDWPMMGGNLSSDRNQTSEHYLDITHAALLQPSWVFDADRWTHTQNNEITGYPVESDGCVFVGSSTGNDASGQHLPGWIFAMNSQNGDVVWERQVPGAVYSTLAVSDGVVYAFVSVVSAPYVVALDEFTGRVLWQTVVDSQLGADAVSSPIVYDGMVWVGVSGTNAEVSGPDRPGFEGNTVLLAAKQIQAPEFSPIDAATSDGSVITYQPGQIIRRLYSIPTSEWRNGYAGGSQWGTISIDPATGYGYEGTGNPFNYDSEYKTTNAILKIDLNRARDSFGQIVSSYKGDIESQVQQGAGVLPCDQIDSLGLAATGISCLRLDLDFGATPNIVRDASGRKLIVDGQKSGVVHFVDADTMQPVSSVRLGVDSPAGGMVGSAATDCNGTNGKTCSIFGSHTIGGYLYSVGTDATPKWVAPVGDGVHWGPPVTLSNGIVYTVDLKGFFDAWDAGSGAPILHRPMQLPGVQYSTSPSARTTGDPATITNPPLSWGGATVARHTVFVSTGVGLSQVNQALSMPDGFVIAYNPAPLPVQV